MAKMVDMDDATNPNGYMVISEINPALILCTDGNFHGRALVGPGGYCAKIYKTEAAAKKHNPGRKVIPAGT